MSRNSSYIKTIVGSNIKRIRELRGLTQDDLSEVINMNTSALSDIERGLTYPKPENLDKIAQALKVPYELLYVNALYDPEVVNEDFNKRIELIKQNPEKFTIIYNYLKILTL